MRATRFRKKPVVIEAVRVNEESGPPEQIAAWCGGKVENQFGHPSGLIAIAIPTLEGVMLAQHGDWIIRGVAGEYLPLQVRHLRSHVRAGVAEPQTTGRERPVEARRAETGRGFFMPVNGPTRRVGVMPKFNLYPRPLPDGSDAVTRVEVGWSADTVQIGTTKLQPGAPRDREFVPGSDGEPYRPAWDGQFVDLDRDQINTLIRTLREARDKAFGRDE